MMRRLPRTGEQIFDSGKTFTPSEIPRAWDMTMDELELVLGAGAGGSGAFGPFAGVGRLQLATGADDRPPRSTVAPSLTVVLPVGLTWLQDGALHVVTEDDGDKLLGPLPANFTGYASLSITTAEDGTSTWALTTATTRAALGSGTLAYVETDADSITLLDAGEARADVIPILPLLLRRLQVLEGADGGSGGGGGGGGGGSVYFANGLWSQADPRNALVVHDEQLAALRAELLEAVANGGRRPQQSPLDQLMHELAITRQIAGRDQRHELERSASANIIGTSDGVVFGIGGDHPDFLLATNLQQNADGSFSP